MVDADQRIAGMSEKPPPEWAQLMRDANVGDPRNGEPSYSALGRKAKLGIETVRKAILGVGEPLPSTIQKIADALGMDVRLIEAMIGRTRAVRAPWMPPPMADLLDDDERKAVERIIRLLTKDKSTAVPAEDEYPALQSVAREPKPSRKKADPKTPL